jgi:hypothetical protein
MDHETNTASKTKWAVAALVALAVIGIAAPLAFADNIGAPTSAAGGLSAPSSPSRPGAVGPLGSSGSSMGGGSMGGSSFDRDFNRGYEPLKLQSPGTGKFEGPHNGTSTPCIGSTGFGSSGGIPGHAC